MSKPDDVVIVGAPRSGTNMLRDVLTTLPGFGTWDCDEVNLMWRHGNREFPSDELRPEHATSEVQDYLRRAFDRIRRPGAQRVVEKTCANSLRVEFVHSVVPNARYIFITRDGLDAAVSAMRRWHAPLDWRYTAAKGRYVPPGDLPYYGVRFVANQWRRRGAATPDGRGHGWWGPKPHDWEHLTATRPLDEVAVIQWQRCVQVARRGLLAVPASQVHHVVYEEFVRDPRVGLRKILGFLGEPMVYDECAVAGVKASSVGKGRASLSVEARSRLGAIAGDALEELGYGR